MNRQGSKVTFRGEERVRSGGISLLKKLSELSQIPPKIIDTEAIKSANKTLAREAKTEFNVITNQVFGIELSAGKEAVLNGQKKETTAEAPTKTEITQEFFEYVSEFKKASESKKGDPEQAQINQQLDAILFELKKLKESSDELENVFKDVVIDEVVQKPGIYHLTFYEGFLKLVLKMRDKVEDGVIFAKLFKSRKQEKSYASMAKKGGTSFTLHQDRAVATQTG